LSGHALYVGRVRHRRLRPRVHALSYRVYMLLIDLDEPLPRRRLLKPGPFGLMSFQPSDHGDGSGRPLRDQAIERLRGAGVSGPIDRVALLTMPRVLGYGFNPISLYWCWRPDGALAGIIHEVTNTFGERHSYVAPADPATGAVQRHEADKRLHVSPFMDMDMGYSFRLRAPGDRVEVLIDLKDLDGVKLTASFAGERRPLTDAALLSAWISHPLLTLKVIAGIHWEALHLWLKGIGYRRKPTQPLVSGTIAHVRSR
jgi:DUF1365 family protein